MAHLNFLSCGGLICQNMCVRKIVLMIFGFWFCGLLVAAHADTFSLVDGTSLTGDIVKSTDTGLMLHLPDTTYTNVLWTKFSQDALVELAKNPKIKPLVEPFIEIPASERVKKPEINIQDATRLELPPKQSLLGALFSSSVGLFALLLIYAANIYSGFEIAVFRARPKALVMGAAVVLPILGPIIFLALPTPMEAAPVEIQAESDPATFAMAAPSAAIAEETQVTAGSGMAASVNKAAGQIFQRGQFTFNRRFFETKFAGFFGATRSPADQNNVLIVKSTAGQFVVERITRISAGDVHLEVALGEVRQEIMVPFTDIQEIQLNPKDA
jgi:hypothetical protein